MPRYRPPEPCIFCGSLPCECNADAKTVKPNVATSLKKRPIEDAPINDSTEELFTSAARRDRFKIREDVKPERDLSYESALRVLRPILSERDQRWVDKQLNHPIASDIERRLIGWKERNGLA